MNFVSLEFVFLLPLVVLCYWKMPRSYRWILLLITSYVAYTYWNKTSVLLMALMTVFTFFAAKKIQNVKAGRGAKGWLILTILVCVSVFLGLRSMGYLPVGISFYTFQMLSYVFEVYAGRIQAERNPAYYGLYISFFPQLVAGPIERPKRLLTQLHEPKGFAAEDLAYGFLLILRGFFKKIVVADYLASIVDRGYGAVESMNGPASVVATICFAFQIYCDFSGYSDIAVGTARLFGIRLMENFASPYLATSLRDFWHRWHISLTGWFTDYVYKPLGGNRKGLLRTCINTLIVFLLSGLWHGLAWTYVIWGGIHGSLLVLETLIKKKNSIQNGILTEKENPLGPLQHAQDKVPRYAWPKRIGVFLVVCFAWIFFRAKSVSDAGYVIGSLITGWSIQGIQYAGSILEIGAQNVLLVLLMLLVLFLIRKIPNAEVYLKQQAIPLTFVSFVLILMIIFAQLGLMASNGGNAFIYFRF